MTVWYSAELHSRRGAVLYNLEFRSFTIGVSSLDRKIGRGGCHILKKLQHLGGAYIVRPGEHPECDV